MLGTRPDPVTRFRFPHPENKVEYLIISLRFRGDRDRMCYPLEHENYETGAHYSQTVLIGSGFKPDHIYTGQTGSLKLP